MATSSDAPHLPRSAPIEAYGKGGFAFADMSHRGSLLCLPDGIWAWQVTRPEEIDEYSLARVFKAANAIDTLIVGTGTEVWVPPQTFARRCAPCGWCWIRCRRGRRSAPTTS